MKRYTPITEIRIDLQTVLSAVMLTMLVLVCAGTASAVDLLDENVDTVKFRGVVTGEPVINAVGAGGVNVRIDEILLDPAGNLTIVDVVTVGYPIVPPFADIRATVGDHVEVCGEYRDIEEIPDWWSGVGDHWVWLHASDHFYKLLPPSTTSVSNTSAPIDSYSVDEDVYAAGSGFAAGTDVDIYVVLDQDWNDGDQIPSDVTGSVETVLVVNGGVGPVLVWDAPLVNGGYDIVIDANQNGIYDALVDGLDRSPGFVVISSSPVPTLAPPGILALVGLLCIVGASRIRRRFD